MDNFERPIRGVPTYGYIGQLLILKWLLKVTYVSVTYVGYYESLQHDYVTNCIEDTYRHIGWLTSVYTLNLKRE